MRIKTFVTWGIEFGPIFVFFISLYLRGDTKHEFLASTELFVGLTIVALLIGLLIERRIALFPLIAGTFVVAFGGLAILLRDPHLFLIKDTIYNGLFAIVLGIGLVRGQGYLKTLFSSLLDISDRGWYILSYRWTILFFLLAVGNEIVVRSFPLDFWIRYKLLATLVTTAFGIYQITLARRERNPKATRFGMQSKVFLEQEQKGPLTLHQKIAAGTLIGLLLVGAYGTYRTPTRQNDGFIQGTFGGVSLNIEVATTTEQKSKGLGGRDTLPDNYGMLFVFSRDGNYGFWMEDTRVPLDIFWLNDKGHVVSIKEKALPESYPEAFYPTAPARFVLETEAGFAARYRIGTGTPLLLKSWPIVSE